MHNSINILLLTGSLIKGGAEKRLMLLFQNLNKVSFNGYIGSFRKINSKIVSKYSEKNIYFLGKRGMLPILSFKRMLNLIHSVKPKIIFSNLRRINVLLSLTRILPIRLSSVIVVGVSNNPKYHPNSFFTRMLYKNTNQLIANSHGTKNYLCKEWGLDKQNVHVIHNGVNSNKIKSLAEDDCLFEWYKESLPIINTIGRLSPQKNHACLIKAFSIVRERTQSRLVIIGEGPLRQSLEELARIVCVAEDTWFAGYQNNPYKFLARSTVFVLPSKWEGFPNVLLEAMVCRVPVISTDVDFGPREIIDHGKTGFLVSSDDPEILADQILYILENRSGTAIKGIISNARKKVETEFSLEVMVKKYQEYFTDVYNSHYAWLH